MPAERAQRLRIVQVLHSHGYGGAETHALALMRGLRSRGHQLVYAGPGDSWLATECARHGIEVHPLRMAGLYDVVSHWQLHRLVRRFAADIVHGHLVRGAHYAGLATVGHAAVTVSTAHATTARKHMHRSRRIIAVSEAVRACLIEAGYRHAQVQVVHNGTASAAIEGRAEVRQELGIPTDAVALVCVGRFVQDKGQDVLVDAIRRLPAGRRPHLYFVGDARTDFGRQVQAQAADLPQIRFLGYRADVLRVLCAFDACVLPSRREALGLAAVEASSAGLPVIATRVGGLPEVVLEGQSGLLVPSDDAQALAGALARLCEQPEQRRQWGEAARRHYLAGFTVEQMVAGTEAVYRSALEARP